MLEKPRCVYNKCYHEDNEHRDGLCWRITQPEEDNANKFCPCTYGDSDLRLFEAQGFMEADIDDTMITKHCAKCNEAKLLGIDEAYCNNCKHSI